ncbi:MAG: type II toxin-antitoxin system HicB family antitoxin [Pyrinomonadaceae bacterium]
MTTYFYVIEKCADTDLFVGYVPGFAGAHSQGETLDELSDNMREVIEMLLEDGKPTINASFIGTQAVMVA